MPVLQVGEDSIGQSSAINQYLARENGLMGGNNIESAQIVTITEHVKEMITAFKGVVPWGKEPPSDALDKWFTGGSTDFTGTAVRAGQSTRYLNWWMGRIEPIIGSKGFAVGSQLSLADIVLFNTFMDTLSEEQAAAGVPKWRREPFCDQARTNAALARHPKILASCTTVATHPHIQKWLQIRGEGQNF
jgi:glutathione S-transferase